MSGLKTSGTSPRPRCMRDPVAVAGDDAAGLLAPVLEGIEAEVGEAGGLGVAVNAEDATVFFGLIGIKGNGLAVSGHVCIRLLGVLFRKFLLPYLFHQF